MKDECPCRKCTPATGRGPGCHTESCPHGCADWDRRHQNAREDKRRHEQHEIAADGCLAESKIRTLKAQRRR